MRPERPAPPTGIGDLVALVRERGIRTVSLMHVGGDAWIKTLDFVPSSEGHLRAILEGGERADGSSLFSGTGIKAGASDIVLRPRPETAFLDPFSPHPTLVVLCGHAARDGQPLPESPDTIVRCAHAHLRAETGVDLRAHGEIEFFLGKPADDGDGFGSDDRGYHAASPFVYGQPLRRRAMAILDEMGVALKYGHSEVGYVEADEADGMIWEQHEIELALAPLPRAADAIVLAQWVLRNLAHEAGMRCSFAPIVRAGHAGSGMHLHLSPARGGVPIGAPAEEDPLPDEVRWLIGGLVHLAGALMAFGNRDEGSFVRIGQGKEAPALVTWGRYNRHALVRLPILPFGEDGRPVSPPTVEFRLPDGSAHPHLLLAGVAQAMLHGRDLPDLDALLERARHAHAVAQPHETARVPASLRQVAAELARHRAAFERGGVFPAGMLDAALAQP